MDQDEGLEGIYKQIELAGKTCYKSEGTITKDSAKAFVDKMIKNGHYSMLEHGTVYLTFRTTENDYLYMHAKEYIANKYSEVRYDTVRYNVLTGRVHKVWGKGPMCIFYITTNYRVLVENDWLQDLMYLTPPTSFHYKRTTYRITTSRAVSHELVRHRVFSFAQESTRYCNYAGQKFDGQLTFIKPSYIKHPFGDVECKYEDGTWRCMPIDRPDEVFNTGICGDKDTASNLFLWGLQNDETYYLRLINEFNVKPEDARMILPNSLKTEVIMTGFNDDWDRFLQLRYFESTGKVSPDMKEIAERICFYDNVNLMHFNTNEKTKDA